MKWNSTKMNILIGRYAKMPLLIVLISVIYSCGSKEITHKVTEIKSDTDALLIGLEAFNDTIVWASGTQSTILKSIDAGNTWQKFTYSEADTLQFRDIHPISDKEAIVLSSGEGKTSQIFYFHEAIGWQKVFQMQDSSGFLDAIQLWENGQGLAYGDAIDSFAYVLKTTDFGKTWNRIPTTPAAGDGEGGFASSGSNITLSEEGEAWIGTGAGGNARVLYSNDYARSWQVYKTPMITGEAAGITAIKHKNEKLWIAGGDLAISNQLLENVYSSENKGQSWTALNGHEIKGSFYGLAVSNFKENDCLLACGPNGAALWLGDQQKWHTISDKNLWTATFINANTALLAGRNGQILKVELQ